MPGDGEHLDRAEHAGCQADAQTHAGAPSAACASTLKSAAGFVAVIWRSASASPDVLAKTSMMPSPARPADAAARTASTSVTVRWLMCGAQCTWLSDAPTRNSIPGVAGG